MLFFSSIIRRQRLLSYLAFLPSEMWISMSCSQLSNNNPDESKRKMKWLSEKWSASYKQIAGAISIVVYKFLSLLKRRITIWINSSSLLEFLKSRMINFLRCWTPLCVHDSQYGKNMIIRTSFVTCWTRACSAAHNSCSWVDRIAAEGTLLNNNNKASKHVKQRKKLKSIGLKRVPDVGLRGLGSGEPPVPDNLSSSSSHFCALILNKSPASSWRNLCSCVRFARSASFCECNNVELNELEPSSFLI